MNSIVQKRGFIVGLFIVTLFLFSQTVFAYPITGNAVKTEKTTIGAGVTPDSFLYFLDTALDNINLALTFDSGEKARKGLDIARERLMEVREMVEAGKIDASQIAQHEHANVLGVIQNSVKGIERANSTEEIEEEIEIEKELEEHKTEIEEVRGELKIKIEVKGGKITPDQQASIDSVLASLEGKAGEVEIEIENEKSETKIKIKQETGKSEEEVENEIEELEEKTGLKEIRKEKAWDKIKDAEEEINETIKELAKLNITDGQITSALNLLTQAKDVFIIKDYKEAVRLAKQAEKQIGDYKEQFEKELEEEEEREIEVEIEGNQTKVKVKVAGEKVKFVLDTANRDEIVSEIASRTGLSISEIESIMKLEIEEPEEEIEIEVEIEGGKAKVKTEINETESEFTLNTTDKDEIVSEIMSRTGLSREQIEKNAEFEVEEETPQVETLAEENISEEVTLTNDLSKVKTWFYFLDFDLDPVLDDIVASHYDMIVIEPIFTEKENENYDIKSAVGKIKNSAGSNVENKLVIAYIDVGQAEDFRYYWKEGWKIGNPVFIAGEDPDLWECCFPVAFWDKEWQDIWFEGVDGYDAQLKMIIDAGFDGVYLDWVEAYSDNNVIKIAENEGKDSVEEIKKFIKKIKDYGINLDPGFVVISQNAAELAQYDDYVVIIDAIAQEQTWFDGSAVGEPEGDCPLPATDADIETKEYEESLSEGCLRMYVELPESTLHVSSEGYVNNLKIAKNKGLLIFTVDYALKEENIEQVYENSRSLGFIPFASNRPLNQFVDPR